MDQISLLSLFFGLIVIICYIVYFLGQNKPKNEEKVQQELPKETPKPTPVKVETIQKKKDVKNHESYVNSLKIGKLKGGVVSSISISSKHVAILKNNEHHVRFYDLKHFHETDKKPIDVSLGISLGSYCALDFAQSSHLAVTIQYNNNVRLFNTSNFNEFINFGEKVHKYDIQQVKLSHDGKFVYTMTNKDAMIYLWSIKGDLLHTLNTGLSFINEIDVTDKYLCVGSKSLDLSIYKVGKDLKLNKLKVLKGFKKEITSLSCYKDQALCASSSEEAVKIFKIYDEEDVNESERSLVLSFKGKYDKVYLSSKFALLVNGFDVHVFNLKTKKVEEKLENFSHGIQSISSSSGYIVTGEIEGEAKVFSIPKQLI